jgi:hypothetical protein
VRWKPYWLRSGLLALGLLLIGRWIFPGWSSGALSLAHGGMSINQPPTATVITIRFVSGMEW